MAEYVKLLILLGGLPANFILFVWAMNGFQDTPKYILPIILVWVLAINIVLDEYSKPKVKGR